MKKIAVLAAITLLSAGAALAQNRPSTLRMSCAEARELVVRQGAIVLSTGRGLYDRYVDHRGYCSPHQETLAAFVPTGDNPQCFVGYTCELVDPSPNNDP